MTDFWMSPLLPKININLYMYIDLDDEVCYVWQYYTDQGDWRSYSPDIQKRVESEYLKRKCKGSIVIALGKGS